MPQSPKSKNIAICHVQVPFIRGGAEVLVDELARELKAAGHNVDVIKLPFKWYPHEKIVENAMLWRMIDIDVSEALGKDIDLVICTKFPAYLVKHSNKILWLFHQYRQVYELSDTKYSDFTTEEQKRIKELIIDLDNRFIPEAKKVFTISKNVSKRLKKYNNIESTAVYPGLKNPDKYFCDKSSDYMLFVSRMTSIKRPEMLLKAIPHIKNKKLKFIFVGKDESNYLEHLKNVCKEEGIEDRVEFKSNYIPEKELLELYANCLGVFYAPYDEDYGYITLEAFFSQKPVITASDAGGPLEFVEDKKNGFIVKPDDYKKIAKRIDELDEDREMAKKMGKAGLETVKDVNWEKALKEILRVI